MNRREFVRNSMAAAVVAKAGVEAKAAMPAPRPKMNVLYLFSDQHREASMPGKPLCPVQAPNLAKFQRENFSMENCISNYPLCTPYRGILISGRYPQQSGVMGNGHTLAPDANALGHTFANGGYHTGYVGKWHLEDFHEEVFVPKGPRRQGFEDWRMWAASGKHYGSWTFNSDTGEKIQPSGWNATLFTDDALKFLHQQSAEKPWFLAVSWNPPHPPFNPPKKYLDMYPKEKMALYPNIKKPTPESVIFTPWVKNEDTLREAEQGYYGSITGIDNEFGRILAALEETGQADNTIVIYTSDHGEMMGAHGLGHKEVPFEESCHVPFIIRIPGVTKAGGSSKELFGAIDIFPTLCGLAGIPVPKHCPGRDMSVVMRGGKAEPVPGIFLMANRGGGFVFSDPTPFYRGIRTETHTYAVAEEGRWILYDNIADPYQQNNLVADPKYKALMEELDQHVLAWQESVGDAFQYRDVMNLVSNFPS
jgi:arylsulfatase A-like enzyme